VQNLVSQKCQTGRTGITLKEYSYPFTLAIITERQEGEGIERLLRIAVKTHVPQMKSAFLITYSTSESRTQARAAPQISPKSTKSMTNYFSNHTVIILVALCLGSSMSFTSSISSSDSSADWLQRY